MKEALWITMALVSWGVWALTMKLAVRSMSPMLVQLCNVYVYSAIAPIAFLVMKWRGDPFVWTKTGIFWAGVSSLLAITASYSFLFAIEHRPVNQVMAFTQTYPAVSFVLCWLVLNESFTLSKWIGAALIVGGCVVMNR